MMKSIDNRVKEFIRSHADEIDAGDYSHFINDADLNKNSYLTGEVICSVMRMLHNVNEEPLSDYDPDLFGMAVSKAIDVYKLPLGKLMSHIIRDWKEDTWEQPPVKEIVQVMKLLGVQVYLFENKNLWNNQKDYLLLNPKNKLEQVLPYLNKDHYTANELEDFQQI